MLKFTYLYDFLQLGLIVDAIPLYEERQQFWSIITKNIDSLIKTMYFDKQHPTGIYAFIMTQKK